MALGIDAAAHRAALDAGGATVAVLGTGADVAYPRAHVALHARSPSAGWCSPSCRQARTRTAGRFPKRNRIIAALATLTIVVEAPSTSGALITARHALELGRDVARRARSDRFAAERREQRAAFATARTPITSRRRRAALVGLAPQPPSAPRVDDEAEMRVWRALGDGAATLDELCARAGAAGRRNASPR